MLLLLVSVLVGTISGCFKTLKAANPNIKVYGIEADESAVLNGDKPGPHKIQGISTGFIPDTLDTKSYDSVVRIPSDELSQHHVHWVAKKVS